MNAIRIHPVTAGLTLAGLALPAVDKVVGFQGRSDHLAQLERGAGGRVDLVPVVRLDDLDVEVLAEDPRRRLGQLVHGIDADGEVGRHDQRDALRRVGDALFLCIRKAGGADHHGAGVLEVRDGSLRAREVDENVGQRDHPGVGGHFRLADFGAHDRTAGYLQRRGELELAVGEHRLDQGAAHAAARAGDGDLHCASLSGCAFAGTTSPSTRVSLPSEKCTTTLRVSCLPSGALRQ